MTPFNNSYTKLPERFFERTNPEEFLNPKLIQFNHELAIELGINLKGENLELIFSGQKLLKGCEPIAMAYAAHQFGHFVPQLGDGRALLLGEINGFDIQLKGSGQTRYSRNGDGRSALGPVIREYIVSEAMFKLGVPTTRALAAVLSGENVFRNTQEPGGIFTRVSPSHIRVGTFQYFAHNEDREGLEILLNYSIARHYPELSKIDDLSTRALAFIKAVGTAQASLISKWMSFGFIHGVMNTDNYSVGGFTIDYGPCAFMDEYKENKVFSSIDKNGRYSYKNQIEIGQWNLLRLVDCLLIFIDEDIDSAIAKVKSMISPILENFENKRWEQMAPKFGISDYQKTDDLLMKEFLQYLEDEELDFTLSFRNLFELFHNRSDYFPKNSTLENFILKWKKRVKSVEELNSINPLFIPRNHQIEKAISHANRGDYSIFNELLEVLKNPFDKNNPLEKYSIPPKVEERVTKTFCGT